MSHFTPEFRARWIAACARMKQAMDGTLPPDAPPVYYSKVYSYLHPQAAIPENTPYEKQPVRMTHSGMWMNRLSDELMDLLLEFKHGSVEAGLKLVKDGQARVVDVIGGRPEPDDPSVQEIDLPGQEYFVRLWTGRMDYNRTVCWNIVDRKTGKVRRKPRFLKMFATDDNQLYRHEIFSLEKRRGVDKPAAETFIAHDGERVEFYVRTKLVKTIRLPQRASEQLLVEQKPLEVLFELSLD
ncbi:hypothetical protein K523DRAFT_358612 [Schizophyllum commune Tattone D]|nr:hypothetical protein K523DRAFT_358612 [Schizophyllum commune Tattone D]